VISLERQNFAQTAMVTLTTVGALVLLGLVAAYWSWSWLAPRQEARVQAAADVGGRVTSANGLFGNLERGRNIVAPTGIAVRLLGVVAASGNRRGYAMLQNEAKQILVVLEGEDISPGIRLAEVAADHVVLDRGGFRETLVWPKKPPATEPMVPPAGK
jgi:general secretion pathway protein C